MAADCEINKCGVLAVGRCARCGKAFCGSHGAKYRAGQTDSFGISYDETVRMVAVADMCGECYAELPALEKPQGDIAAMNDRRNAVARYEADQAADWKARRAAAQPHLEALLHDLLDELERAGQPGLERLGPFRKALFGGKYKPTGPLAYFTYTSQVDKGFFHGDTFKPLVDHFVTPDGQFFERDGTPDKHHSLGSTVSALYRHARARVGVTLPVHDAIAASPDWPDRL